MVNEDFLCEDCGYRSLKAGSCPRCDSELVSLKVSEQDPYESEDEQEMGVGDFAFDDDFDFSDEAMPI